MPKLGIVRIVDSQGNALFEMSVWAWWWLHLLQTGRGKARGIKIYIDGDEIEEPPEYDD